MNSFESEKTETETYYRRNKYGDIVKITRTTNGFIGSQDECRLVPFSKEYKKASKLLNKYKIKQ